MATSIKDITESERNKLIVTCSNNLIKNPIDSMEYKANLKMLEMLMKYANIKELDAGTSGIELE